MTFDKFAWLKAVYAEPAFTPGEKAVLAHIAVFNVLTGKDMLRIRQSTIADQCGISRPTVNGAIGQAELLGYLTVSERHKPAPGRNTPAEWQLLIPEPCKESEHGSANHVKNLSEPCKESGHGSANHVKNLSGRGQESGHGSPSSRSSADENDAPTVLKDSSSSTNSSIEEVCDHAANGELVPINGELMPMLPPGYITAPSGFCDDHPTGEDPNCRRCWDRGKYRRQWMHTPEGWEWQHQEATLAELVRIQGKSDGWGANLDLVRNRHSSFPALEGTNGSRPHLDSLPDIDDEAEECDPNAPLCGADGCDKPATFDGLCGRCAIYRPGRNLVAGNSAGGGELVATVSGRRRRHE